MDGTLRAIDMAQRYEEAYTSGQLGSRMLGLGTAELGAPAFLLHDQNDAQRQTHQHQRPAPGENNSRAR
jgi:hypothetical protein